MSIAIALIIWAAALAGLVEGLKRLGKAAGCGDREWFVRSLPLIPFAFGLATGVWVLPAVAAQAGLAELAGLPPGVYAVLGFGAGAVAGQAYKVLRQSIQGDDWRLRG